MRNIFTVLFFFSFGCFFSQKTIVFNQYDCLDDSCEKKLKQQFTFNKNGDNIEYIAFGKYKSDDTIQVRFVSRLEYKHSKILKRTHYKEQYFLNSYNYSYKRGRLDNVYCHDGTSIRYFYDPKGNVKSDIMTNGLDTLRVITYSYRNNELYETFRHTNEIDNERIIFSKSNDTIIETSIRHDSIYMNEPRVDIIKKKYNKYGLAYSLAFNKEEESTVESFITYDSIGNISEIEYVYVEEKIESKEKYEINYRNGFVNRIEKFELINNIWQQEDLIIYKLEMTNKRANEKIKSKINFYFIKKEMGIL